MGPIYGVTLPNICPKELANLELNVSKMGALRMRKAKLFASGTTIICFFLKEVTI